MGKFIDQEIGLILGVASVEKEIFCCSLCAFICNYVICRLLVVCCRSETGMYQVVR